MLLPERSAISEKLAKTRTPVGAPLHRRSRHQNQAVAQKLGILREKVTSMAGLKSKSSYSGTYLEHIFFHFTLQISIKWPVCLWRATPV